MGLHRKESQSFNGFGKILTKTIKNYENGNRNKRKTPDSSLSSEKHRVLSTV